MDAHKEQDFTVLQRKLVEGLKSRGHIVSSTIEAAFRAVPRHLFLPQMTLEEAYSDEAIVTKTLDGRIVSSSSQPAMMAIMLAQLQLQPGQRVLEIGAGTGYNAALMAHIVGESGQVVTIDIDEDIVEGARNHLAQAGYERVQVLCGDGFVGYPAGAPYDRIILTVNASDIAPAWREQLKPDGRLLLPLSVNGPQVAVAFEQREGYLESGMVRACRFVGLRGVLAEKGEDVQVLAGPDGLYLILNEPRPIDGHTILHYLSGRRQDIATGVQVTLSDVQYGLSFWLALHEPQLCVLIAYGSAAQGRIVPMLFHGAGKVPVGSTLGLLGEQSLALLMRHSLALDGGAEHLPFLLRIRSFGEDQSLAFQLKEHIMQWRTAGRPGAQQLRIRAYPYNIPYSKTKNELLVSKQWTQFVFNW